MSNANQPALLPRDYDQASFSEVVPFRSRKINLLKSPILYLTAFTAIFAVVLFYLHHTIAVERNGNIQYENFTYFVEIALFYLMALPLVGVHAYAKTDKPITYYLFPCLFIYLFLTSSLTHPIWSTIFQIFDALAGGKAAESSKDWVTRIWAGFAGPGLREELVKGLPILLGAAMTVWAQNFKWVPERLYNLLRVRSPLDGVLMGFAVACAFTFYETAYQYIPDNLVDYFKQTRNLNGAFGYAMTLLIPRAMNVLAGHTAYSCIFGYFIGLAVIRPRLGWQLVLGGWMIAALPHGLWDAGLPGGLYSMGLVGVTSSLMAVACLIKARQLEASLFGRSMETSGSIIVDPDLRAPAGAAAAAAQEAVFAVEPATLALVIDGVRLPLQAGHVIDLGEQGALSGRGQGIRAEVIQHPTNAGVLGLKNLGTTTWYARMRDDKIHAVEGQRSLRLSTGISIDFGGGLVAQIAAA